jgi:hypothetical protein
MIEDEEEEVDGTNAEAPDSRAMGRKTLIFGLHNEVGCLVSMATTTLNRRAGGRAVLLFPDSVVDLATTRPPIMHQA